MKKLVPLVAIITMCASCNMTRPVSYHYGVIAESTIMDTTWERPVARWVWGNSENIQKRLDSKQKLTAKTPVRW